MVCSTGLPVGSKDPMLWKVLWLTVLNYPLSPEIFQPKTAPYPRPHLLPGGSLNPVTDNSGT